MAEIVVYTDATKLVIDYLKAGLAARGDAVDVTSVVPSNRPARLVRVSAAGGGNDRIVLSSRRVIVQCWDRTVPAAAELAELCCAILLAAYMDPSVPEIRDVSTVGGPAYFPDPDTALPRYQFTVSLDLRGTVQ